MGKLTDHSTSPSPTPPICFSIVIGYNTHTLLESNSSQKKHSFQNGIQLDLSSTLVGGTGDATPGPTLLSHLNGEEGTQSLKNSAKERCYPYQLFPSSCETIHFSSFYYLLK